MLKTRVERKINFWGSRKNFEKISALADIGVLSSNEGYAMPKSFGLDQNYPNPFNPTTQIDYKIPENNFVNITIYDVMGHKIKSLVNTEQEAGHRSVHWNATNDFGETVPAGMYIYLSLIHI